MRNLRGWDVVHDGCLVIRWRDPRTGEERAQRKRRRAGVTPDQCTWHASVHCADHPHRAEDSGAEDA
jgi:hypothetical protein